MAFEPQPDDTPRSGMQPVIKAPGFPTQISINAGEYLSPAQERNRRSDQNFRRGLYALAGGTIATGLVFCGVIIYALTPTGDYRPLGTSTNTITATVTIEPPTMTRVQPTLTLLPQIAVLPSETPVAEQTEEQQIDGGTPPPDPDDDPTPTIEQPDTATLTPTHTATSRPTVTLTPTETLTNTPTITYTPTLTPSATLGSTDTLTPFPTAVSIDLLPTGDTEIDNLEIRIAAEIFRHDDMNPQGTEWGKWFPGITYPVLDPGMNPELFNGILNLQARSFQIMALADTDPAKAGLVTAFSTDFRNLWASFGPAGHRPLSIDRIMAHVYGAPVDGIAAVDNMIARQQEILREEFSGFSDTEFQSAMRVIAQGFSAVQNGGTSLGMTDGSSVLIFLNPGTDMPELFNANTGDSMIFDSAPLADGEVRETAAVRINTITGSDPAIFAARNRDQNRYLASGSTGKGGLAGIVDRIRQPWTWIKSAIWGSPDLPPRADSMPGEDSGWVYTIEVHFVDDFGNIVYNRILLGQDDGIAFYPGAERRADATATSTLPAQVSAPTAEAQQPDDDGGGEVVPPTEQPPVDTPVAPPTEQPPADTPAAPPTEQPPANTPVSQPTEQEPAPTPAS